MNPENITMAFQQYHQQRPRVTCRALVEKDGKFLLLFAPWCERWTLPGGGLDGFETPEETMVRELKEELGIDVNAVRFLGYATGRQYAIPYGFEVPKLHLIFHAKTGQEVQIDESEASDHKWVTLEEMRAMTDLEDGIEDFLKRNPELRL